MTIVVSLLYAAEVALTGVWRWTAIATAVVLIFRRSQRGDVGVRHALAALLIAFCALEARSVVLVLLAILIVIPRRSAQAAAVLSFGALGVHLAWWRYLAGFPVERLPEWLVAAVSWLSGSVAHVTSTALLVRGHTVKFSHVAVVGLLVPLATALFQLEANRTTVLRFLGAMALSALTLLGIATAFSLAGHVHFFAAGGWPLVPLCVGTAGSLLITGRATQAAFPWGRWFAVVLLLVTVGQVRTVTPTRSLRILFDEAHGKWETIDGSFGTGRYGRDTTYNYVLLARWLEKKHTVGALRDHWTDIDADVLVVKMPTEYYNVAEKSAIERFVRGGGLLVVLGDHTNLYGTAFVINDLLRPYGLEIEADASVPWDGEHYDYRPAWWQRSRYLRSIGLLQFQTAASIRAHHPLVVPVLAGDRVSGEDADYSNERFFGDLHPGPEDRHPPLVFAAERRLGQGRVLLFGDSTIFSTFSVMAPGNSELFQNFIEQGTSGRSLFRLWLVLAVAVLGIAVAGSRRILFAFALLPAIAAIASGPLQRASLDRYPADWIEVDGLHSSVEFRFDPRGTHGVTFDDYSTFFAWIGRTGALPRVSKELYTDVSLPTVVINPDQPFTHSELERVERYVKGGGRLLVMDDLRFSARSTAKPLLERLGISVETVASPGRIHEAGPPRLPPNLLALPSELMRPGQRVPGKERAGAPDMQDVPVGVSAFLVDERGRIVAGQRQVGNGIVVVFQRSAIFSDFVLGDVWGGQEVDPEQLARYQLEYDLIALLRRGSR